MARTSGASGSAPPLTDPMPPPGYAWIAVILQVLVGIGAVAAGIPMIADANGNALGIPHDWIAATPFGSFLLPGIVLVLMNGVGQLGTGLLVACRHPLAPWLTGALGIGLMVWILVQVALMPFFWLQPVMFAAGAAEGFVGLFWLRREGHLRLERRGT